MTRKTRIIAGILGGIVALAIIGGIVAARGAQGTTFETATVTKGTVVKTVDISGNLEKAEDLNLAFSLGGVVGGIPVTVGSSVSAGDILMFLDADDLIASLEQAQASLAEANANYAAGIAGGTTEEQAQAETALANARSSAATTATVQNAAVATAEAGLTQATADAEADRSAALQNIMNAQDAAVVSVRSAVASADSVLGVENNIANDDFDDYLANLDPQSMNDALPAFAAAATSRDALEDLATDDIAEITTATNAAFADATYALLTVAQVLDGTLLDTREFSADDLEALKSTIATARVTLTTAQSTWSAATQTYATTLRAADDAVTNASYALTSAQAARDRANADAEGSVSAREADLALVKTGATGAHADALLAAVTRAAAAVHAAEAALANAELIAPIDGVVTEISVDVGEYATPGMAVVRVISRDDTFLVALDVAESDVDDVAVGQAAHITLDALGDEVFTGKVLSVAEAEKDTDGAVFYEAKVLLTTTSDAMRAGMSADVVVDVASHENVLYVPQRAVIKQNGAYAVRVPRENAVGYVDVPVTIAMRGDDGVVEIASGLTEGQEIIVRME